MNTAQGPNVEIWATVSRRRKHRRPPRTDREYVNSAETLSRFVPSLQKYRKRKKLKPQEKAAITRAENTLSGKRNLFYVQPRNAKKTKRFRVAPNVNAIQLRNTQPDAEVRIGADGLLHVKDEGRYNWVYIPVPDDVHPNDLPAVMEQMGEAAFDRYPGALGVSMWNPAGRVGELKRSMNLWGGFLAKEFMKYREQKEWIKGIAVLVSDDSYEPGSDIGEEFDFEDYDEE